LTGRESDSPAKFDTRFYLLIADIIVDVLGFFAVSKASLRLFAGEVIFQTILLLLAVFSAPILRAVILLVALQSYRLLKRFFTARSVVGFGQYFLNRAPAPPAAEANQPPMRVVLSRAPSGADNIAVASAHMDLASLPAAGVYNHVARSAPGVDHFDDMAGAMVVEDHDSRLPSAPPAVTVSHVPSSTIALPPVGVGYDLA